MALALERHFGKELGDSVITAVELSDKAIVERQEMSAALVEVTRQKAISSLSKINIDDVFNSNRPFRLLLTSLGVFLGGYGALFLFFTLAHPASPTATMPRPQIHPWVPCTIIYGSGQNAH